MVDVDGFHLPDSLPTIEVTASEENLGSIDCRELQWWFAVPEVGHSSASACYDVDTGKLDFTRSVVSTSPTSVNGEGCGRAGDPRPTVR